VASKIVGTAIGEPRRPNICAGVNARFTGQTLEPAGLNIEALGYGASFETIGWNRRQGQIQQTIRQLNLFRALTPESKRLHKSFTRKRRHYLHSSQVSDCIGIESLGAERFELRGIADLPHALHYLAACFRSNHNVLKVALRLPSGDRIGPRTPCREEQCYDLIGGLNARCTLLYRATLGERRNDYPGHDVDRQRPLNPGVYGRRRATPIEIWIDDVGKLQAIEAGHAKRLERSLDRGVMQ
jgi:hypothetical protein